MKYLTAIPKEIQQYAMFIGGIVVFFLIVGRLFSCTTTTEIPFKMVISVKQIEVCKTKCQANGGVNTLVADRANLSCECVNGMTLGLPQ